MQIVNRNSTSCNQDFIVNTVKIEFALCTEILLMSSCGSTQKNLRGRCLHDFYFADEVTKSEKCFLKLCNK